MVYLIARDEILSRDVERQNKAKKEALGILDKKAKEIADKIALDAL